MSDTEDLAALNDRLMAKNHALAEALSRAGKELTKAKSQLAQLAQPPLTFATMVKVASTRTDEDGIQHASAEVISGTRRMVVPVASNVNAARLTAGATVMLNEKLVLVEQRDADTVGQIRSVKQVLDDGRLIVTDASGNPVLIRRSGALAYAGINQGDRIIVDPSVRLAIEALPAEGDKDLVLEEISRLQTDWQTDVTQPATDMEIDLFDQRQLETVLEVCRRSASLSEAGRELFAVSRLKKANPNDADRLRKYLARFSLSWESIRS